MSVLAESLIQQNIGAKLTTIWEASSQLREAGRGAGDRKADVRKVSIVSVFLADIRRAEGSSPTRFKRLS
jgi:hypothetical protein